MQLSGKDLVLFIINNNLMDITLDITMDEKLYLTPEKAAVKLGIGTSSLLAMYRLNLVPGIKIGDEIYFFNDIALPSNKKEKL